jgi:hypothetical protein
MCKPVRSLLRANGFVPAEIAGDVDVLQLTVSDVKIDDTYIELKVLTVSRVQLNARAAPAAAHEEEEVGDDGDVEAWLQAFGSDLESVASAGDDEGAQDTISIKFCVAYVAHFLTRTCGHVSSCVFFYKSQLNINSSF